MDQGADRWGRCTNTGLGWEIRGERVVSDGQSLVRQVGAKRSEMMLSEIEAVALRLFDEVGFNEVTVEEIASTAGISARTFYRYFPSKEDVLQLRIDRRSEALRAALARRPPEEPPFSSLRIAFEGVVQAEDAALLRRWTDVIAASPGVVKAVLGGIQLKSQRIMAEFFSSRLALPSDGLVPTMLAAAVGGVVQAAQIRWYITGVDLVTTISRGLDVLERGIGADPEALAGYAESSEWPMPQQLTREDVG
jgi:AcrR family transcriptional regulator